MHWLDDPGNRIGLYWALAALLFGYLAWGAFGNIRREFRRPRLSVLVFGASWCVLMVDLALARYGAFGATPAEKARHVTTLLSEAERIVAVGSLLSMVLEYRLGRILTIGGGHGPTVEERSAEAQERMASATEVIADQVAVMRQGTEG